MDEVKTSTKNKDQLTEALEEMINEVNYRSCAAAIFFSDGVKLLTHGTPTPELEMGMIMQTIHALWMRYQQLAQARESELAMIAQSQRSPDN